MIFGYLYPGDDLRDATCVFLKWLDCGQLGLKPERAIDVFFYEIRFTLPGKHTFYFVQALLYGVAVCNKKSRVDAATCTMTFQDLISGESSTYQTASLLAESGMDSARINVYDLWDNWYRITLTEDDEFASYNVNPFTGEYYPMTLYYEGSTNVVLILSEMNDKLLVRAKWDETREGDTLVNLVPVYALITKEDYLHSVPNFEYITGIAS